MTGFTGTPSSLEPVASAEALEQLEFPAALESVARLAVGPHGASRVRARWPLADLEGVRAELRRVRELGDLLRRGDAFRPEPVGDVEPVLEVLAIDGGVLEGADLAGLRRLLEAMHLVAGELRRIEREAPAMASLAAPVPPRDLIGALGDALEADGAVKDTASAELGRARRRVRATRARLIALLEGILRGLSPQHAPADATVTVRGGRYVIPVFRDARVRVGGIVQGESGSGATLFVEPQAAVDVGNELAEAEAEEARAVQAVLRRLTLRLRPHATEIAGGWRMCVEVDDAYARACYMVETGAQVPTLHPAPCT
ncbi:MAG: hypothetical protein HY560_04925, partial [Gemmatimonadetes bacterium]|nr:hypothetical protein [Gemmatimonadota bacterium]